MRMLRMSRLFAALACAVVLAGCPYRIEVQQGNFVSQDMVDQLKEGMSKDQVRQIMGTPLLADIFHADRWDYIYSRAGTDGKQEKRKLAVFFADGKLTRVDGEAAPARPTSAAGR